MALFNKDRKRSKAPATDGAKSADGGRNGDAPLTHRVTKDLDRAETLAAMLAHSRASRTRGSGRPSRRNVHLRVGASFKILGAPGRNRNLPPANLPHQPAALAPLDSVLRPATPRGRAAKDLAIAERLEGVKTKAGQPDGKPLPKSAELQAVLKNAEQLSPARDFVDGRPIPILTCECVLLAIAKRTDSEIGHRLVATGLDIISLEESARNPKHAPKH